MYQKVSKWSLVFFFFLVIIGSVYATSDTKLENISFTSTNNSATINVTTAINVSSVDVNLNNITFNDVILYDSCYVSSSNITDEVGDLIWSESGRTLNSNGMIRYFSFNDTNTSTRLQNYTLGVYSSIQEYVKLYYQALSEGNTTYLFSKIGFPQENITFSTNYSEPFNITYNTSPVFITLKAYDEDSPSTQLTFNLSAYNDSRILNYTNQINFSEYLYNFVYDDVTLSVDSIGYSNRKLHLNPINPYINNTLTIYLQNASTTTPVIFQVVNNQQGLEGAVLTFYRVIGNSSVQVGQAETDSTGFTYFNMNTDLDYVIHVELEGYTAVSINSIPTKTTYVIILDAVNAVQDWELEGLDVTFLPDSTSLTASTTLSVVLNDEDSLLTNYTFNVYSNDGTFNQSQSGSTPAGSTLQITVPANSTRYYARLTGDRDGTGFIYQQVYTLVNSTTSSYTFAEIADITSGDEFNAVRILAMLAFFMGFAVIGSIIGLGGSIIATVPIIIFAIVGWLPVGVSAFLVVFMLIATAYFRR